MGQAVQIKPPEKVKNVRPESKNLGEWSDAKSLNSFVVHPTADFQKEGDEAIGIYLGARTLTLDAGKGQTRVQIVYDFEWPNGEETFKDRVFSVWGTAALSRDMENARTGKLTRIEYVGELPSGKGNDTQIFDVRQK